jgi:N-acyl-D-amino-acid deacylase
LPISGQVDDALNSLDRVMCGFVTLNDIPGAAMAVTKCGRLVYARGFGFADVENQEPVKPQTLFRIASVSKPITAVAVLQLVERGKLSLTDHPFDLLTLAPHLEEGASVDPRLKDITIHQLLQHTAGWDRDIAGDPMVNSMPVATALGIEPPAMPEHIIRYMMGKPLDFAPGMRDAYSNFGYCLLGRLIEKASGHSYEDYVRAEVLAPLGIADMRIGKTLREGKLANETCYYDAFNRMAPAVMGKQIGEPVPAPYGEWCLEAMDAHGGWVASAVDLVRFASAFDSPEQCKILSARSVATMFDRPPGNAGYEASGTPKEAYYACGWHVRPVTDAGKANTWHGGALNGSAAYLVRRFDYMDWAVVFNTMEAPHGEALGSLFDFYGQNAINKVDQWPEIDLFDTEQRGLDPNSEQASLNSGGRAS